MALAAVSPEDRSEATAKAAALRDSARSQREESPYLNNVNKLDESK